MLFFPDLFSPYIKGREMAIASNWADRANYSAIYDAQLGNLNNKLNTDVRVTRQPGLLASGKGESDAWQKYGTDYWNNRLRYFTDSAATATRFRELSRRLKPSRRLRSLRTGGRMAKTLLARIRFLA